MNNPLISLIVTTRNNTQTLDACLASVAQQTYDNIELIVVDNNSTDNTKDIAKMYTSKVYNKGPERSAQRNFAANKAQGDYVFIIDSDMELSERVVEACVTKVSFADNVGAVIIPEISFGEGFWARCKQLERSYYAGRDEIEAARFFRKDIYIQAGGYDETMTGGEDWDLTRRVRGLTQIGRIGEHILHNEGRPHFLRTVKKMYYYGQHAGAYFAKNPNQSAVTGKSGPLARFALFFSRPAKLLRNPFVGFGMLFLKTSEFAAGGLGYVKGKQG